VGGLDRCQQPGRLVAHVPPDAVDGSVQVCVHCFGHRTIQLHTGATQLSRGASEAGKDPT
jgi:hypothetical protein